MKQKRAIKIQRELLRNLVDLYTCGSMFHYTSEQLNEKFAELFKRYPADLPGYVREYIRGYRHALDDNLYRYHLVHGFEHNGRVFCKWDDMPEEIKELVKLDKLQNGHYWKDTLENTPKPYFIGKG